MPDLSMRRKADFNIFTGLLKASRSDDGKMRLRGVASSTTRDLHGDTMLPSALDDMVTAANNNLTIFLNHSYNVPEDVGGSVEAARIHTRGVDGVGNPNYDLDFDIAINEANPRAVQTFEAIERGVKLGLSIGAAIPDGGAVREKKSGALVISHVNLLETSLVGIPANPRSWVEYAVKSLGDREIPEVDDEEPVLKDGEDDVTTAPEPPVVETYAAAPDLLDAAPPACTCTDDCDHEDCTCDMHKKAVEPDVTSGATVTVWPSGKVSVTTDDPENPSSQDAPPSTPDTDAAVQNAADVPEEPVIPAALKEGMDLMELVRSIADATAKVAEARVQIDAEKSARLSAEADRDRTVKAATLLIKDVKRTLDKIADTPLARKSQFIGAQADFNSRFGGSIDEEVLKMLLR